MLSKSEGFAMANYSHDFCNVLYMGKPLAISHVAWRLEQKRKLELKLKQERNKRLFRLLLGIAAFSVFFGSVAAIAIEVAF